MRTTLDLPKDLIDEAMKATHIFENPQPAEDNNPAHVKNLSLTMDWKQIIEFQFMCLKSGLNGIGIPDLVIAQNAKQHGCEIYSLDSHFMLIKDILDLRLTS